MVDGGHTGSACFSRHDGLGNQIKKICSYSIAHFKNKLDCSGDKITLSIDSIEDLLLRCNGYDCRVLAQADSVICPRTASSEYCFDRK